MDIAAEDKRRQLELLSWLRKETQHSQGDIPSTRRLLRWWAKGLAPGRSS